MITVTLVERTPHRLRYEVLADGIAAAWSIIWDTLAGDAQVYGVAATPGLTYSSLAKLIQTGATTQAAARQLLDGQGDLSDKTATPFPVSKPRAHVLITPAGPVGSPGWSVDEDTDGAHAIITGTAPLVAGERCLVTLEFDTLYN